MSIDAKFQALLNELPVQARTILETCYDIMSGNHKPNNKKSTCTHIVIEGQDIRYVEYLGRYGKIKNGLQFVRLLIGQGLMEEHEPGKFRPTKEGFNLGKISVEQI
jgi:hypothetical protein